TLDNDPPAGLVLDSDGFLHGTPVSRGNFELHVSATDGTMSASRTLLLTVAEPGRLALISAVLPDGTIGQDYSYQLQTIGHVATATLAFSTMDMLPPGLALMQNGRIAGVPEKAGSWSFTVLVAEGLDASAPRDTAMFIVSVLPEAGF